MAQESMKVERRSASDQAADIIRTMILERKLEPGQSITQDEMSKRLGVSTMPIREALIRLSYEGFVVARKSRSFLVAEVTRSDVRDIYWMYGLVSGELAARACANQGPELGAVIADLNAKWRKAGDDVEVLDKLNHEFHRQINLAAESPKLVSMVRNLVLLIPEHFYRVLPEWPTMSLAGHEAVAAAFDAADPEKARTAMQQHVDEAAQSLIAHFAGTGYWSGDSPTEY